MSTAVRDIVASVAHPLHPTASVTNHWSRTGRGVSVYLPQVSSVIRVPNDTEVMSPRLPIHTIVEAHIHTLWYTNSIIEIP